MAVGTQEHGQLVFRGFLTVWTPENVLMVAFQPVGVISATQKAMSHFVITSSLYLTASERVSKFLHTFRFLIYKQYRTRPVLVALRRMYFSTVLLLTFPLGLRICGAAHLML